jgi:hypothetical protein
MHSGNAMGVALPSDDDPSTDRGLQMPGETRVLGVASAVLGSGSRVCRVGIRQSRLPCWDIAECGFGPNTGLLTQPCSHCWRSTNCYRVETRLLRQATCKEPLRPAISFHMKATIEEIGIEGVFDDWQARGARGRDVLRLNLV